VRNSIDEIVFAPAVLDTKVVPDLNNPLGGFTTIQDVTFFDGAIDPQFRGTIYSAVSGLTFSGSGTNALGQNIFAAGANPGNLPLRGPKVRIFNNLGPSFFDPGLIHQPIDDFQAFNTGNFPGGAGGVAFGFGALPVPGVDVIELAPIAVDTLDNPILV
jgi:hypothetical protein